MENIKELIKKLETGCYDKRFKEIYVDRNRILYNRDRFIKALECFMELYGDKQVVMFSAPGRSEVCGNHTDHQNGHVLATSINLDAIGIASPTQDMTISLVSDDFPKVTIDLEDLSFKQEELETTDALIRGVVSKIKEKGYRIGGFQAYVTSDVLIGAGMSSSAAFECLIGTIISGLYNDMKIPAVEIAQIGQYAENVYFGKPCGLMDQMACSVGGLIYIDFSDKNDPAIEQVYSDFEGNEYSLCIVDTKGSHADLTEDYAAIPQEMKEIAGYFGEEVLGAVLPDRFYQNIAMLRQRVGDRSILRGIHFFQEQVRVSKAVTALRENKFDEFLNLIRESGNSSSKLLQNIYSPKNYHVQNVTLALAVSEYLLDEDGVCRVHGGGFAGTIQAFVKNNAVDKYKRGIEAVFGEGSCHVLKVRQLGGIQV